MRLLLCVHVAECHTRLCFVALYGHGLCVCAAERAEAEADSKLLTVPQWALVCGRYACVHICMYVCIPTSWHCPLASNPSTLSLDGSLISVSPLLLLLISIGLTEISNLVSPEHLSHNDLRIEFHPLSLLIVAPVLPLGFSISFITCYFLYLLLNS